MMSAGDENQEKRGSQGTGPSLLEMSFARVVLLAAFGTMMIPLMAI